MSLKKPPKGHSNVFADRAEPHPNSPDVALVPIEGGAAPGFVRRLPPLSLTRDEWKQIGRKMGWIARARGLAARAARAAKRFEFDKAAGNYLPRRGNKVYDDAYQGLADAYARELVVAQAVHHRPLTGAERRWLNYYEELSGAAPPPR